MGRNLGWFLRAVGCQDLRQSPADTSNKPRPCVIQPPGNEFCQQLDSV
jgi:hypothetical protein